MFGGDATQLSTILDISHPVKNGLVDNWEDLTLLLEHVFGSEEMKVEPKTTKLVLTESPASITADREEMLRIMFEKFGFHSVFIGNQAALSLFGKGLTSGVVVNIYEDFFDACPVHFYALSKLGKRLPSADMDKISEIIFNIIQSADEKIQPELLKRIILTGSTGLVEPANVEAEIKELYLDQVLLGDEEKLKKLTIKVESFPTSLATDSLSLLGGRVLGGINKDQEEFWMTRKSYQEVGAKVLQS